MSPNKLKVLAALDYITTANAEFCASFDAIGRALTAAGWPLERRLVRLACRSLKRDGLAEFHSGAGYCISKEGRRVLGGEAGRIGKDKGLI